ncbi:hypothetical protein [Candidatus Phytoplasma sacchari]
MFHLFLVGMLSIFIRNISEKKRKEQDEDAHNNYIKKLKKNLISIYK